tara:strand:- start:1003 stop:1200 length:198 start_codon:yes stop_codon:yes gene_type:complete
MALINLKSIFNRGAGKPTGSPSGRHTISDTITSKNDSLAGDKGLINTTTPDVPKYKDFTANGEKS